MGRGKAEYDAVLRCRAPSSLRQRLERILERRGYGDIAELMRDAIARYVEAEELRLGITSAPPPYHLAEHFEPEDSELRVAEEPTRYVPVKPAPKRANAK